MKLQRPFHLVALGLGLALAVLLAAAPVQAAGAVGAAASLPGPARILEAFDARGAAAPAARLLAHPAGIPLTKPSQGSAEAIALQFIHARLAPVGEIVPLDVTDGPRGIRFVQLEQRFGDWRVLHGRIDVAILADGSVLSARVGELAGAAPPPLGALPQGKARIVDPAGARAAALAAFGLPPSAPAGPKILDGFSPERVLVALTDGAVRAWRVQLAPGGRAEHFAEIIVAAADGRVLAVTPLVQPAIQGARVWPRDPTQPSQWITFPDSVLRPSVDSPMGWDAAGATWGNNAWVELDRESNFFNTPPAHVTASGDPLVLDFPVTGDPQVDTDAAVTNMFWAINDAHDRFRQLGFDEASGNCQDANLQRGGLAGDRVYGMAQWDAGDGTRASNFVGMGVGSDGSFTYLLASLFRDENGVLRDGALETDLLYHELTHSATVRLVGGDSACFNGAQPQAVSEGISDFMAASFTNDPVIGAYTSGRPGRGHREFPIGGGGWSYVNLCEGGCNRSIDGEIMAGLLWDLQSILVQRLGLAAGTARAQQLALEAMRFGTCRPTFIDMRDAMLVADSGIFDGADRCAIWQGFAGRGVGYAATTSGPDDQFPVGGYDVPPECSGGSAVSFDAPEYSPDADALVEVVDARLPAGAMVVVTSSGGDTLTLPLNSAGGALLQAGLSIRPGVVDAADGVLQVASGDTISAAYAGAPTDTARISTAFPVRINDHHVWGEWCQMQADDDYSDAWYVLPGFLDAGENANIEIEFAHDVAVKLEDVMVQVTSLNPNVMVLPVGPIAVGDVIGRNDTDWERFDLTVRANASTSVVAGELATLRFDITSRGRATSLTLTMQLNMDYEVVPNVSAFDAGVETFERGSSTASQWSSEASRGTLNLWAVEDCAGTGGSRGWRNGNAGCTDYSDGQVAATLLSPPIFPVPSDTVAYRMRAFEWDTDVNLYTDPANGYCDADFVGMFVTTDPTSLPFDDPEAIYSQSYGACQRYWRPIYESTGGYARQRAYSFTDQPRLLDPAYPWDQVRLAFIFYGDVYDCGFEAPNAGRFRLDNVSFSYDVARTIPESTPCTADCVIASSFVMDPPGPKCAGEPFTLRSTFESSGCAGIIHHAFSGPGVPPEYGWTELTDAPAIAADGGYYAVYSECETSTDCADYSDFTVESKSAPGIGGPWPDSLRVTRSGDDVSMSWTGASVPPAYAILRATTRLELAAGAATWLLAGTTDVEGPRGEASTSLVGAAAEAGVAYYQVFGRDLCSDVPRIP